MAVQMLPWMPWERLEAEASQVNKAFVVLVLTFIFMFGTWTMEIGELCMRFRCYPTNGWFSFNPWQVYHFGLYLQVAAFMVLALLYARNEKNRGERQRA